MYKCSSKESEVKADEMTEETTAAPSEDAVTNDATEEVSTEEVSTEEASTADADASTADADAPTAEEASDETTTEHMEDDVKAKRRIIDLDVIDPTNILKSTVEGLLNVIKALCGFQDKIETILKYINSNYL